MSPARKRPEKTASTPPEKDVREKRDPAHTETDFLGDLDRVATNRAKQRLASEHDRGSRRT